MRLLQLFSKAIFLFAVAGSSFAGSYPRSSSSQGFNFTDGTTSLGDGSSIGSDGTLANGSPVAAVIGAKLRLTDKSTTNVIGAFKLPDVDPGNVIKSFDLKFGVVMNRVAGTSPAEGWSVNFGNIPPDNGTGEGGFAPLQGGLTIAFDTLATADDPSAVQVFISGVSIATFPKTFAFDLSQRAAAIHWDSAGLSISYDGRVLCTNLPTPGFNPGPGNTFAFSARCADYAMDVLIDDVRATTEALPVIETGGPVISEFMANNGDFEDEFGDKPAWIELLNGSTETLDLSGWYLTDSKKNLAKWKIEHLTLTPYNYQVAFASGRDRQLSTTSFLHTSFSLAKSGGYVALVKPDGVTVASSYEYGPQDKSVSYGEAGQARVRGYMYPASPGAVNTSVPAPRGFAPEVQYSHPGGFIGAPVTVSLSVPTSPQAQIRYTLDRTDPGPSSPLYTAPLSITQFTTVRARVYAPGYLPGPISRRTFVMMDGSLTNYSGSGKVFDSNLPLVYLDTFGVNVDGSTGGSRPYRPAYALVISPDPATGRASLTSAPDYSGPAGAHVHGESSAGFDQRSYSFEIWDESGQDQNASLLGLPSDSDWILYGPWSEKTLMRNKLIFDWMRALRGPDGTSVRARFIELFFNQSKPVSGKVGYSTYRGVYLVFEKIKQGKDRVPIEKLNDKTIDPDLITGGYIIRHDKPDALKNNWNTARFGISMQSFDPDRLNSQQFDYIKSYINNYETALNGSNYRNFTNGYQAYIDPDTFIDAQWMLEIAKQVDGYVFSTYWHKDRDGRLRAGPLWDFNIALGNADYGTGDTPTGWYGNSAGGSGQLWYPRLHTDPEYKLAHWDRYWELRQTLFATDAVNDAIDRNMALLLDGYTGVVSNRIPASVQNPAARHFRRWPRLGIRDWPNPPAETSIKSWQAEVDYMRNWLTKRLLWLDDQSLRSGRNAYRPPVFSHAGGIIASPLNLEITPYSRVDSATTFPSGDIYYTLNNSDPRLPGGRISPDAKLYTGPVPISASATVQARLFALNQWSPLAAATYFLDADRPAPTNLVFSELMIRPGSLNSVETNALITNPQGCEFIELHNAGTKAVDLSGAHFTKGIDFDFAFVRAGNRLIRPGESLVIVSDKRAFQVRYPQVPERKILGQFRGHLDTGGETIELSAADGTTIQQVKYDNKEPWPAAADGSGRSLVLASTISAANLSDPANWTLSAARNGTPGISGAGSVVFSGDPLADTDGDGVTDLFEFASGSDPLNPGSLFRPAAEIASLTVNGSVNNYLLITYQREPAVQGVSLVLERSADLKNWSAGSDSLTPYNSETNDDGTVIESYRSGAPLVENPVAFYRVSVKAQ